MSPARQHTGSGKYTGFFLTDATAVAVVQPQLVVNSAKSPLQAYEKAELSFGVCAALTTRGGFRVMKKITLLLAGALMAIASLGASAAVRVFVGPPVVGYGFYGPYWGPRYFAPYDNSGSVRIDSKVYTAQVFVNGAYSGTVKDNKTMHFRQGNYNIEIRNGGQTVFSGNVFVTAGKTMHISPGL
jgi:PEGA domain